MANISQKDEKIILCKQLGCSDGYAISASAISWSFLRAVVIEVEENCADFIYAEYGDWPNEVQRKVKECLMIILEKKLVELTFAAGFDNWALESFYECQRSILKDFMNKLAHNIVNEIYRLLYLFAG